MTDTPTPNLDPGYDLTLLVRDIETGATVARLTKRIVFQVDALPTRDDGKWSQAEMRSEFSLKAGELLRELRQVLERSWV